MFDIFNIDNILFTVADKGVSLLELLSTISGITCVFLAAKGKSVNFYVGYVYTMLLFFLFLQKHLYSSMLLQPVSFTLTVFGHYRWTHPKVGEKNKKNELKVTVLTKKRRIVHIAIVIVFALVWGFILSKLGTVFPNIFPARLPFLDATITILILTAQYLSAQKKIDCWITWMIVNVTNLVQYLLVGLIFMPAVCAVYFAVAIFGLMSWLKIMKNDKKQDITV